MFTLKVTKLKGHIVPSSDHSLGGVDLLQIEAFKHIEPDGFVPTWRYDLFCDLARAHGWEIDYIEPEEKGDS